ncbi:MAG TPA: ATP-binding protein [Xylanibacter oryzae]|nr:ATP-binding protein [Xylanibacter oryzae]
MLINFTFQNFRSFRDEKTLSMEAGSIKELKESVIEKDKYRLLPVSVLYGANSSGKSNVLSALLTMRGVVLYSVRLNPSDELFFNPFMLDIDSPTQPTSFEIELIQDGAMYRYGFDYNKKRIIKEWLYEKCAGEGEREHNLFLRVEDDFEVNKSQFPEGSGKEDATAANRLFVSLVAQLKGEKSKKIIDWFGKCNYLSGLTSQVYEGYTLQMLYEHRNGCDDALNFFHHVNLGFNNIIITEKENPNDFSQMNSSPADNLNRKKIVETQTTHNIYNRDGSISGERAFAKDEMESEGTKKVIEMSGPIFDTLNKGKLLVVDELDAKLHPLLTRNIVGLFMDPNINRNGAQLIFATHDTHLLNLEYLRRDQIWFTEKDNTESSDLYSLIEFRDGDGNKVRNDSSIEKDYINGRYGAIPFFK